MPTALTEGALTFTFPGRWTASKLDEWSFLRKQLQPAAQRCRQPCGKCESELSCERCGTPKTVGVKAMDFLALPPDRTAWLIEVKDYRREPRTKAIDLADEVAAKARDSMMTLAAAAVNANDDGEKGQAR